VVTSLPSGDANMRLDPRPGGKSGAVEQRDDLITQYDQRQESVGVCGRSADPGRSRATTPPMILAASGSEGSNVPGGDLVVGTELWLIFAAIIAGLLLLDLFVLHKDDHEIEFKEAAWSSAFWISIGVLFSLFVWNRLGGDAATQYLTGYVIEKSLSVDNVFVWAVLLSYFAVPKHLQHRVLFWGIFGALVLRTLFVFTGVALLNRLEWLTFVFGAFLVITAYRVATHDQGEVHPERNPVLKLIRRRMRVTADYEGHHFLVKRDGKRWITPLMVVLIMVELTDVVFAVDSIPAILAVSRSQYIVLTSNAFAILGLRALFFLLAGMQSRLVYLHKGLGVILAYVGVKMLVGAGFDFHIPTILSLGIIASVLGITIAISLRATPEDPLSHAGPHTDDESEAHTP